MAKITIQEAFEEFHRANPHIYEMFIFFAKELLKAGHKRISPRHILERIRWELMAPTKATRGAGWHVHAGKPFKINNNFSSRYARLFLEQYPKAHACVEIRELKSD